MVTRTLGEARADFADGGDVDAAVAQFHAGGGLPEDEFAQLLLVLQRDVAGDPAGDVVRLPDQEGDENEGQQQKETEEPQPHARTPLAARGILVCAPDQAGKRRGGGGGKLRQRQRIGRADGMAAGLAVPEQEQPVVIEAAQRHADFGNRHIDARAIDVEGAVDEGGAGLLAVGGQTGGEIKDVEFGHFLSKQKAQVTDKFAGECKKSGYT